MPTIVQTYKGRVTGLWGKAMMRGPDGKMHLLELGDVVQKGDVILTAQDGIVRLSPEDSDLVREALAAKAAQSDLDRVISDLNRPDPDAATAAGLTGGDGAGDLTPGLRVDRIAEAISPGSLPQNGGFERLAPDLRDGPVPQLPRVTLGVESETINATEEGSAVRLGLSVPRGLSPEAVITVNDLPVIGQLVKADGSAVVRGSVLTATELAGLQYLPPADYNGTASVGQFSYSVTDRGTTETGTVSIHIDTVNDAPVAQADIATTLEDTPLTGNVLTNDSDVDGNTLRVTQYTVAGVAHVAGSPAAIAGVGTLTINADGSYSFTPAADYNGPVPVVTYTISDGTVTTTSTLTISVTAVNDPPDVAADLASTPINVPLTIPVLANDRDRDGDPLTVTSATVTDPTRGSVSVNPDGTLNFTPSPNFVGSVTINYTVSDGHGGTGSASVTVSVGSNTPPTGADSTHTIAEDGSYTVRTADLGFADADAGQTLANVRIDTLPAAGTLLLGGNPVAAGAVISAADVAAGRLVFVPVADGNGTPYANLKFSVQDSAGAFDTVPNTLSINVTPVNDAPVTNPDSATTLEDTPAIGNVLANDRDVDGDVLRVTQFSIGGNTVAAGTPTTIAGVGTLVINADGAYTFTPAANYNGPVPVATYTATDGTATSSATLTLVLTPVNDAPVAGNDLATTPINTPLVVNVLANDTDVDGDPLTVSSAVLADPSKGSVAINPDGTLTFTPAANVAGPVVITYVVSDGHGGTGTATVTINVGSNTPPTGADSTHTLAEDTSYVVKTADFGFADADLGQTLSNVRIDALPAAGTLLLAGVAVTAGEVISAADVAAGKLVFVPVANGNGAPYASFGFSVQDSAGAFDTAPNTLTLNVTPVNDAPVANPDTATTLEDTPRSGNVLANDTDVDGDTLSVTQFVIGGTTYAAGSTATLAGVGTLVINGNGAYTFTPAANYNGTVPVATYTVSDGTTTASSTLSLSITPVNDAPVANPDTATTLEDTPRSGNVLANDTDVDGDTLRVTQFVIGGTTYAAGSTATLAGVGSLLIGADGSYTFTPAANYNGAVPVATYTVSDGTTTATSTLTIAVTPVNDAPVANPDSATTLEDTVATGNVLANDTDVDGDTLRVTQFVIGGTTYAAGSTAALAGVGTLVVNTDGSYTFTPAANYNGAVPITTYTVSDGTTTSTSTLAIAITAVNDAPVAVSDSASTPINTSLSNIAVLANDSDVDGDPLTVTSAVLTNPALGSVTINPNGTLNFTPANNINGPVAITYTISDGHGGTASATLTVNVGANTPPSGADATVTLAEDTSRSFAPADFGFSDPDVGQTLANVRIDALPIAGTLTLNGVAVAAGQVIATASLGQLVFTPAANGNGATYASFTFSVQDSAGAFDPTPNKLTLNVTPVNDAPVANPDTATTLEDTPRSGNVLTNDTDVDGDTLSVTRFVIGGTTYAAGSTATLAGVGTLVINGNGAYTFTPAANYNGAVPVATYTVSDGTTTASSTLSLSITPVNDAPVANPDTATTLEDTPRSGNVLTNDTDVDGDTLSVTQFVIGGTTYAAGSTATLAGVGTLVVNSDGSYTFTPAANYNGSVPVATYTVSDGTTTATSTLSISLTPVNDPPVAVADTGSATEDVTLTTTAATGVLANDTDPDAPSDTKTVSAVSFGATAGTVGSALNGTYGTLTLNADGSYSYLANRAPAEALGTGQTATEQFSYTVRGRGRCHPTTTLTFTITGTNDAPVAVADTGSATEDVTLTTTAATGVLLNDTDLDSTDSKTVSAVSFGATTGTVGSALNGTYGTLTLNADGSYSYLANRAPAEALAAGQTATEQFNYTMRDAAGATSSTTLTFTITGTNDAPVAVADTRAVTEDVAVTAPATGVLTNDTDVDTGDTKTVSAVSFGATAGTVGSALNGTYGTLTLNADGSYSYLANRAPAEALAAGQTATEQFTYTMRDAAGATSSTTLTFTITGTNDAPVAVADTGSATEDVTLTTTATTGVLANDTDPDATDSKTVSAVSFGATAGTVGSALNGTYGTLTLNADGSYSYLANRAPAEALAAGQTATEQFTYTVRDAAGATSSTTLTFTITGTNDAPVAVADTASTLEDTPLSGNVLTNDSDVDGNTLSVTQFVVGGSTYAAGTTATLAGVGTLVINGNGAYTFTPAANYNGAVPVATYTLSDGTTTASATLTLSVTPVNDPPVANPDTATTLEDTPRSGNVLTNDTDVDGDALSVTRFVIGGTTYLAGSTAALAGIGTLVIAADGAYTFTPAANYNGAVPVATYTVSDGTTTSSSTLTINITPVNDAPIANADTASTAINTPISNIAVLANDADVDGDPLTVTSAALTNPALGTVTINPNGTLNFNPAANITGAVTINYTISDGHGGTAGSTLTVNVGTNTPPTGADKTLTIAEDTPRAFSGADFGFADVDAGQTLANVRIDTLPAAGTLTLNGAAVTAGEVVSVASLGNLVFTPAANANGAAYASFTFSVQDNAGAFDASPNSITINVTPVNDPPVAVADTGSATEDVTLTTTAATGVLANDTDPDAVAGDTKTVSAVSFGATAGTVGSALNGTYGTLTLNADGSYSYLANRAPAEALGTGQTATEQFSYTVRDAAGATSSTTLTFTITGTNDAPVAVADTRAVTEDVAVTAPATGVLTNDTDVDTGDTKTVSAVSFGATAGTVGSALNGTYGTLTLNADGSYSYLANRAPAEALAAGQTATEQFTYTMRDAAGATSSTTLTFTITGTNDAPVAVADTGSATEDVTLTTTATTGVLANDTDPDATDSKTVSAVSFGATAGTVGSALNGTYGTLTLNADGSYSYLANRAPAEALAAGQTATEQFSYTMRDAAGATSSTTLTFTITGTNDAPVAVADTGSATEDVTLTTTATTGVLANDTDPDATDSKTVSAVSFGATAGTVGSALNGTYGTLTLNADGSYSYLANRAPAEALAAGQTATEQFTYTMRDAAGATSTTTLTFTITGTNDAPVAVADTGTTLEDTPLSGNVLTNDSDVDGNTLSVTQFVVGGSTYAAGTTATLAGVGTLVINGNGAYTFTPAANYNGAVPVATYTLSDGTTTASATLTLSVTPVNDAPVAVADTGSATEDVTLTTPATGVLANDTDVDTGDTKTVSAVSFGATAGTVGSALNGTYGTLTLNADGSYSYLANRAPAEALAAGQTATEQFNYTMRDAAGATSSTTLTFTITGTNDAPVAVADTRAVTEDVAVTAPATGVLANDTDVDTGDTKTVSAVSFGATAGTVGSALNGTYGTLTLNADGSYSYLANRAPAEALAAGQTATEQFTYTMRDAAGATSTTTLTFTITGTNDAPVAVADTGSATEDVTLTTTATTGVLANDTDPDATDSKTVSAVSFGATAGTVGSALNGTYGTLTLNADGSYSYLANRAPAEALAAGQTATEQFSYTMRDAAGATSTTTLTFTITGTNDAPVAVADTASTLEDTPLSGNVLTNDSDVDGNTLSVTQFVVGGSTYAAGTTAALAGVGTLVINGNGAYTFTPAANYNGAVPVATYTLSDGTTTASSTLTLSVTPVNDAPVAVADTGSATEDVTLTTPATGVLANDTDVDTGDTKTVSAVSFGATAGTVGSALNGTYGTLTLNADGSYSYLANRAPAEALAAGQTATEQFNYTMRDAAGATSSTTLTFTITGTNDAPVAVADTRAVTEDVAVTAPATGVLANDTDVDTGDTKTVSAVSFGATAGTVGSALNGTYGTLTLNADGSYSYLANRAPAEALAAGQTATEQFSYTMRDAAGATSSTTLTFTITGTNDAPVAVADTGSTLEDTPLSTTAGTGLLSNDSDVDTGSSLSVTQFSVAGVAGSFTAGSTATIAGVGTLLINANGSYTFTPAANFNGAVPVVTYVVSDGSLTSSSTLTLNVTPVNDPPVAVADTGSATEDVTLTTTAATGVLANDTDPDSVAGDTKTVSAVSFGATAGTVGSALNGTYGTLTLNADGSYSYLANRAPAEALGTGQTATEQFSYTVRDAAGATSTTTLTFTITGTNDAPVAVADTRAVTEDVAVTAPATGVLTNDTDVDTGDTKTVSAVSFGATAGTVGSALNGTYGTLTLNADGSYSYLANRAPAEALAAGQTATEQFSYTMRDAAGATSSTTLTFTITGTNDAPVAVADTRAATEDVTVTATMATGVLANDTDVDFGDSKTVSAVSFGATAGTVGSALNGTYGTLTLNADGSYSYLANRAPAEALAAGQTATEQFNYTMTDAAGATSTTTLTFTITGTNDAPVAVPDTATATEAGGVANGTAGTNPSGNVLTNDTDADTGDTKTVSAVSGGAAGTIGGNTAGAYGTLVLNANGTYTYTVDNNLAAVQALRTAGDKLTDTFTYTVSDAAGATSSTTLTVTITGSNDAPIATADTVTATEDVTLTTTATTGVLANDSDVDLGDSKTVSAVSFGATAGTVGSALNGTYGTLTLNADGSYSYLANRAPAEALGAGQTATEQFSYTMRDAAGATSTTTLTFTITGTNDAPVAVADTRAATEDVTVTATAATGVLINDTDVDNSDTKTVSAVSFGATAGTVGSALSGTYGSLTLNADGSYSYLADKAPAEALGTGQTATEQFSYTVRDAAGATSTTTLTFTITGTNDAPVAVADTRAVTEDVAVTAPATGVLANDTDVDTGDTKTVSAVSFGATAGTVGSALNGTYGTLTLNADGSYSYLANKAPAEALAAGQTATEQFSYTMRDAAGATSSTTLTFTITGANDAPVAVADTRAATEDVTVTATAATGVLNNDTDIDTGDNKTVSAVSFGATVGTVGSALNGTYGTLTLSADGSYSYLANRAPAEALAAGQTATEQFSYTVRDAAGATSSTTLTFTITGTNDAPVAVPDTVVTREDTVINIPITTLLANDSDVDGGTLSLTSVQGAVNGTVSIVGGNVVFTPASNFSGPASFTYTISDGQGGSATTTTTVNVTPVADAPTLTIRVPSATVVSANSWESNNNTDTTSTANAVTTFEGWTRVDTPDAQAGGTNAFEIWTSGDTQQRQDGNNNTIVASAGNGEDFLELNDASTLVQTIGISRAITTQAGMVYEVSFDYAGRPGFGADFTRIGIYIDGALVTQATPLSPQTYIDWQNGKVRFDGDGGTHTVLIRTDATQFNTAGRGAFIDDVVIAATQGVVNSNASTYTNVVLSNYVSSALVDTDGSESLALKFTGLAAGSTIVTSANPGGYTATGGEITISASELASAQLHLATSVTGHVSLGVIATSTEGANGATASTSGTLDFDVLDRVVTTDLGGDGLNNIIGTTGNDNLTGTTGNDYILGGTGNDTLNGGNGNDYIDGGVGNDVINGGAGNDFIWGGAGNDTLTGGAGTDTFVFTLADASAKGSAATLASDVITDFNAAAAASGGDVLDLRDLLVGEYKAGGTGNLQNYLDFDTTTTPGSTIIHVSSTGGFTNGTYTAGQEDERITLQGVDLRTALALGTAATDNQIIQELLNRGKLVTDGA